VVAAIGPRRRSTSLFERTRRSIGRLPQTASFRSLDRRWNGAGAWCSLDEGTLSTGPQATEAERAGVFEDHAAFDKAVRDHGTLVSGDALAGVVQARTLRTLGGTRVVTDGPYVETVKQHVGYCLIDVLDAHTAVDMCRILPEWSPTTSRTAPNSTPCSR
jgi:hypothetical protein